MSRGIKTLIKCHLECVQGSKKGILDLFLHDLRTDEEILINYPSDV